MTRRPPAGAPSPRARALGLAVAAVVALLLAVPTALAPGLPGWGGTGATPAEAATTPAALQLTTISPDVTTSTTGQNAGMVRVVPQTVSCPS